MAFIDKAVMSLWSSQPSAKNKKQFDRKLRVHCHCFASVEVWGAAASKFALRSALSLGVFRYNSPMS